ncbi:MAG: phage Gp37/Gp68 family protein [Rhodobacter sp.]|nr:phage Gp37/Gp68 family protein [Rhodobacter sp.]
MADTTKIEWSDATWNPITGCTLVSPGCENCYAAELAASRFKNHPSRIGLARRNAKGVAKFTGEVRFNEGWLTQPLHWRKPRMVFVCAHGDLFHEDVPDDWIDRIFAVMALCPQHTFQVLTKQPKRMRKYISDIEDSEIAEFATDYWQQEKGRWQLMPSTIGRYRNRTEFGNEIETWVDVWPLPNVWLGVSVEDQKHADERIPALLQAPAAIRFISAEPLLGPIDLRNSCDGHHFLNALTGVRSLDSPDGKQAPDNNDWSGLDWVIVGGESGKHARPMHPRWARSIRDQCQAADVPFFFKQWGAYLHDSIWNPHADPAPTVEFKGEIYHRCGKTRAGRYLDTGYFDEMPKVRDA